MVTRRNSSLAVAVAGLFLVSNLAGLFHYATTRHVRCAEHNELIHVGKAHFDPGALVVSGESVSPVAASIQGGHDHCSITILHRERMAVLTIPVEVRPAAPTPADPPQHGQRDHASIARYVVAPKTSPPA